jgi:hypothetical protein
VPIDNQIETTILQSNIAKQKQPNEQHHDNNTINTQMDTGIISHEQSKPIQAVEQIPLHLFQQLRTLASVNPRESNLCHFIPTQVLVSSFLNEVSFEKSPTELETNLSSVSTSNSTIETRTNIQNINVMNSDEVAPINADPIEQSGESIAELSGEQKMDIEIEPQNVDQYMQAKQIKIDSTSQQQRVINRTKHRFMTNLCIYC